MKAVEENGEEAEPVRNGAESVSEGEGVDANSGSTDSSGEGVTFPFKSESWKPADTEGKKQYDREFCWISSSCQPVFRNQRVCLP